MPQAAPSQGCMMSIKSLVGAFVPYPTKARIFNAKAALAFLRTGGTIAPRQCNCCGYEGPFYAVGLHLRRDAACPRCHSLERHRLFKVYFDTNYSVFDNKSVLHFAPEPSVARFIRPAARKYLTADLMNPRADAKINIEDFDLPDKFDAIIASHILEHVNDRKALASIRNALDDGGILLALVPIAEGMMTFEDPTIVGPRDRELFFGQYDHVRYYGSDFVDRISNAGFSVERFTPTEPLISKYGLMRGETVFVCRTLR
jgi:SAM-dependent methyltransferase